MQGSCFLCSNFEFLTSKNKIESQPLQENNNTFMAIYYNAHNINTQPQCSNILTKSQKQKNRIVSNIFT